MSKAPTLADDLAELADKLAGDLRAALPREKKLVAALREARSYIAVADTPTDLVARIDALLVEIAPTPDIASAFRAETESAKADGQ